MSKVVLDAVGGDHAPDEAIAGVVLAIGKGFVKPEELILTGPAELVRESLTKHGLDAGSFAVQDAPDVLTCDDSPIDALKKKPQNSVAVGIQLVKAGKAQAFISAGSTGTVVGAATLGLRCLEGIRRPAIAAMIHGDKNPFLVLDVGANAQPKAHHLAQFALMGAAYYGAFAKDFGVETPTVGILNIGSEERKGNPLVRDARSLITQLPINFYGYIEGVDVFHGDCHVVVTDGFTGNVLLKASEGVAEYLMKIVGESMAKVGLDRAMIGKVIGEVMPRVDFSEYGGALLLGVEGIVTICHGRSRAPAFANAIRVALHALDGNVNQHIEQAARAMALPATENNG